MLSAAEKRKKAEQVDRKIDEWGDGHNVSMSYMQLAKSIFQ